MGEGGEEGDMEKVLQLLTFTGKGEGKMKEGGGGGGGELCTQA